MKNAQVTYLYCIAKSRAAPRLPPRLRGLPGMGLPRLLRAPGGLWLVVSNAPLDAYGQETIDRGLENLSWLAARAVAHQGVIDGVKAVEGLLPVKLFTLFSSDARALEDLGRRSRQIQRAFRRVSGCEEWALRVVLGPRAETRAPAKRAPSAKPASGAAFLREKKRLRDAARETEMNARREAEKLHQGLRKGAVETRRQQAGEAPGRPGILLEAAYLVRSRSAPRFRGAARRMARDLEKAGLQVSLTGPWPPYNFVGGE